MTGSATYGWSGVMTDGSRVFVPGVPPVTTAITDIQSYAAQADYAAAYSAYELSKLTFPSVQATQTNKLNAACSAAIMAGFSSAALGSVYAYPSKATDQTNMLANAVTGGDFMCQNAAGAWALVAHTAAQAQTVLASFITARDTARAKLTGLSAQVQAATTITAVQAVVWQ